MKRYRVALHRTIVDSETAHVVVEAVDADEARRLAVAAYEDDPDNDLDLNWAGTSHERAEAGEAEELPR